MSLIKISELTASYGAAPVLRNVQLCVAEGRVTALVGPNGCGKSTLLKAILGLIKFRGSVNYNGRQVETIDRRSLAREIAYLPQDCHCPDYLTVAELVELGSYSRRSLLGGPSDQDRILFRDALEQVGLADRAGHYVNTLSGGQRQRAWIAMVLSQNPSTILLDEPVNHLDVKYQYAVLELIRSFSRDFAKTIVIVLHDLNLAAAFADDVVMMKDGEVVVSGSSIDTITAENVRQVFDLDADIFTREKRLVCLPHTSSQRAQVDT